MLNDDRPIMDRRWGDESDFQYHKEVEESYRRTKRHKGRVGVEAIAKPVRPFLGAPIDTKKS